MYCVTTGIQDVAKTKTRKSEALLPPKVIEIWRGGFTYHRGCDFELCYHNIKENGNLRSMEGVDIKAAEM